MPPNFHGNPTMSYIDYLISGIVAFIMLSVGLSLSVKQFVYLFSRPRAYIIGLTLQIIVLPLLAFAVVALGNLSTAFGIGIIILAACPGGMTSNFITYLLNANAALSILLTVTNSIIALFSIPLIVNLAFLVFMPNQGDVEVQLSFWDTVLQIFTITLIPVFVGIVVRKWRPAFADGVESRLKWITVFLLAIVFLIKFFASEQQGGAGITLEEVMILLPYSFLVNVLGLGVGYAVGKVLGFSNSTQVTLGVEIGIQNTSLAFLIASTIIGNEDMLKPALVYAMFSFFTAVGYGLLVKPTEARRLYQRFNKWRESHRNVPPEAQ